MLPDSSQQKFMVDVIKQTLDIKLKNPIVSPASLTRYPNGIKRGFSRPIAIGVC